MDQTEIDVMVPCVDDGMDIWTHGNLSILQAEIVTGSLKQNVPDAQERHDGSCEKDSWIAFYHWKQKKRGLTSWPGTECEHVLA